MIDPTWHVSSRSGVATLRTDIHLLLTYLLTHCAWRAQRRHASHQRYGTNRLLDIQKRGTYRPRTEESVAC